eukprot:3602165-Alexandrium_andersonii.AAC.1
MFGGHLCAPMNTRGAQLCPLAITHARAREPTSVCRVRSCGSSQVRAENHGPIIPSQGEVVHLWRPTLADRDLHDRGRS